MKYRRGIFFVVYRKEKKKIRYLVLKRKLHWIGWEFPKAGVESKESDAKAIKRELKEEAGCKVKEILKFNKRGRFRYKKDIPERKQFVGQSWKLFAVEVDCKKIKVDKKEHSGYKWLSYSEAKKILTWPNQKKCLEMVNQKLKI